MKIKTIKKARKRIIWILFISILCLMLISFLPWITIEENGRITEELNFNYEMMRDSENTQINSLANSLMDLNILFWTMILISLISFVLIIYYVSVKSTKFSEVLILTSSFIILILCIIVIFFQILFSRTIYDIEYTYASMMISPFAYANIQFILSIILVVISGSYTITIFKDTFRNLNKQKKEKRKKLEKIINKPIEDEIESSLTGPEQINSYNTSEKEAKLAEITKLLDKKEIQKDKQVIDNIPPEQDIEKKVQKIEKIDKKPIKEEGEIQEKQDKKIEISSKEDNTNKGPFSTVEKKKQKEETDEIHQSEYFEKALSSAIEKKQSEMKPKQSKDKIKKTAKKNDDKQDIIFQTDKILLEKNGDSISKVFNIKCPDCNHIFPSENVADEQKITCPNCGKEGNVRKNI